VMMVGSLLAATTTSFALLIVARVLQGSATAIFPLALSVIRDQVPPEKLPGAMALVSSTLAFGSGLSLVVTGLLTQGSHPNYHSIFWVSAGLSLLSLVAALLLVPHRGDAPGGRIDYLGTLALAGFLVLLLLGISQGHDWGWTTGKTLCCFAGAVLVAMLWVLVERKVASPLVDLQMFTQRQVALTNLSGLLFGFAMFAQFIGISYLVQMPHQLAGYGFTASVLRASIEYLLPSSLVALIAAPAGGLLVSRTSAVATLTLGGVSGVVGFAWLAFAHGSTVGVILASLLTGTSIALGYAAMPALIAESVPLHQTGIANGINSISRSIGSSIASAVVTSLLASKSIEHLPAGVPPLPQQSQFTITFVIGMSTLLLTLPLAQLGLARSRGRHTAAATRPAEGTPQPQPGAR
jgi:MFS family permease